MTDSQTPSPQLVTAPTAGRVLSGRYRLVRMLARGGMADVWEGTDTLLERPVAIKVLHPHLAADEAFVRRFRTEAVAAARLTHPAIVAVYDTCSDHGIEAIVLELVRGRTLREELDRSGPLEPAQVADLGTRVARALGAAHRAGVVHRDVKPANILLADDDRVLVTDFGIAKLHGGTDRTDAGTMLGSAKYLAPEQVEGAPVDGRCDEYALATVLYEALTGRVPFDADSPAAVALERLRSTPRPVRSLRPAVSPALDAAVMRALARDRDDRFPTTDAFADALRDQTPLTVADPDATLVEPRPHPTPAHTPAVAAALAGDAPAVPTARPGRRRRVGVAVAVLALVGAALVTAAILLTRTEGGQGVIDAVSATSTPAAPVAIRSIAPFDPAGDGREGNDTARFAIDGNPSTGWRTEMYDTRNFGNLKSGVGIVAELERATPLGRLELRSPTQGWAAQAYVADRPGTDLAGWGAPVAQVSAADGDATLDLHGATGRFVLIWVTDLGSGPPRVFTQIDEVVVRPA